mgnify:CR=1 FL=1
MSRSTHESLPTGWISYPFWAIATEKVITGRESEGLLSVYLDRGVIPYSEGGGLVHKPAESLEKYQLVEAGDFVMNNQQAWRGSVGVSKYRGIVSPAYLVFSLDKSKLLPEYAAYMFRDRSYVEKYMLSSLSVGDIQRQIKWNHLRKIAVQIPSKEEQQALTKYLDQKTTRIDALIEKKTRFIELLKEKRQAVITNAVTKGLDTEAPLMDSGIGWLKEIPQRWKTIRAKRVFIQTRTPRKSDDEQLSATQKYGVVPQRAFMEQEEQRLVLALNGTDSFRHVDKDDFVISLRSFQGGIERCHYSGCVSPAYTVLKNIIDIHFGYFAHLMKSHGFIGELQITTTGIREGKNISYDQFGNLYLPMPPIEEQAEISRHLDKSLTTIDELIHKTERSIELLKEHRSALITAAVTGKIDFRMSK